MKPTVFIVFGATGDLATRKVIPALFTLFTQYNYKRIQVIATARKKVDTDYIFQKSAAFISDLKTDIQRQHAWHAFQECFTYQPIDLTDSSLDKQFSKLKQIINLNQACILVYCAVASKFFKIITQACLQAGILDKESSTQNIWHKIAFEKPFGHNQSSAKLLHTYLIQELGQHQIFYVDHYLAKERIASLVWLRATNVIFEQLWHNRHIDTIHITLDESVCINKRGAFFDDIGTIQDVVQNHMLQMLALVTMEIPTTITPASISQAKSSILKKIDFVKAMLGQYDGYRQEQFVRPTSKTETFAQIEATIKTDRWSGVNFILRTGKCLRKKVTRITVIFKQELQHTSSPNIFTINIDPHHNLTVQLNTNSYLYNQAEQTTLNLTSPQKPAIQQNEYEFIILNIIKSNRWVFASFEEIYNSWRIIDDMQKIPQTYATYKKYSNGPPTF